MPSLPPTPLPPRPLIYLITSGATSANTTPESEEFSRVLRLIEGAVAARVGLLQIREKKLSGGVLFELAKSAAKLTRGSETKLLINDRADITAATGADGVHLTTSSLPANAVRKAFGEAMLIGASTHSAEEALAARAGGASFVVYGPVFETKSKSEHGQPVGVAKLAEVCSALAPYPILALGGVTVEKVNECLRAGASGIAGISLFQDPDKLADVVNKIRVWSEPPA